MSPRRVIIGLTSVCLVLIGCETLKEQMTKDGAGPAGAPAGESTTQPTRAAAAVMTPFEASGSFKANDPVETVSVRDARGLQRVPVVQAKLTTQPTAP